MQYENAVFLIQTSRERLGTLVKRVVPVLEPPRHSSYRAALSAAASLDSSPSKAFDVGGTQPIAPVLGVLFGPVGEIRSRKVRIGLRLRGNTDDEFGSADRDLRRKHKHDARGRQGFRPIL